jgi:pyruvate/2-oxoglutarate dehydrogenase complex dihydrolipoamide acyltransferase (E2) component
MHPVVIPREHVNDETVTLLSWLVANGEKVTKGQPIAEVETSKAVFEMEASESGYLRYDLEEQAEVPVGGVLCYVAESADAPIPVAAEGAQKPVKTSGRPQTAPEKATPSPEIAVFTNVWQRDFPASGTRISAQAMALIQQHNLSAEMFQGHGLVRSADVRQALSQEPASTSVSVVEPAPGVLDVGSLGVAVRSEPLSRTKRSETRYLTQSRDNTLPSMVSTICPTRGLRAAASTRPEIAGSLAPIIVFETARLLRKHPMFNAFYHDGKIHYYEQVNVGVAVDAGQGLKVPIIKDADRKSIAEIGAELRDRMVRYMEGDLELESLSGGTFTITDLSGEDAASFLPLINQWQSAILGLGSEYFPPGSREGVFNLILSFDHQVTEGRRAALLLQDLKQRLMSYERAMGGEIPQQATEEAVCASCLRTASELEQNRGYLLQAVDTSGNPRLVCSICLAGF